MQGGDVVGQGRPLLVEFAEQAPEVGAFGSFRGADEVDELTFDVLGAFAGVDGEVAQPDLAEAGREVVEGIGGLSEEEHALARVRKRRRDGDGDLGGAGPRRGIDDDGAARDRCIDDGLLVAVDVDDEELLLRLPVGQRGDGFLEAAGTKSSSAAACRASVTEGSSVRTAEDSCFAVASMSSLAEVIGTVGSPGSSSSSVAGAAAVLDAGPEDGFPPVPVFASTSSSVPASAVILVPASALMSAFGSAVPASVTAFGLASAVAPASVLASVSVLVPVSVSALDAPPPESFAPAGALGSPSEVPASAAASLLPASVSAGAWHCPTSRRWPWSSRHPTSGRRQRSSRYQRSSRRLPSNRRRRPKNQSTSKRPLSMPMSLPTQSHRTSPSVSHRTTRRSDRRTSTSHRMSSPTPPTQPTLPTPRVRRPFPKSSSPRLPMSAGCGRARSNRRRTGRGPRRRRPVPGGWDAAWAGSRR